jgi:hypothetical protein
MTAGTSNNQLVVRSLKASGDMSSTFKSFYWEPEASSTIKTMGGSMHARPDRDHWTNLAYARSSQGTLMTFRFWFAAASFELGGPPMTSAPSVATGATTDQVFYAAGSSKVLYHYDSNTGTHTRLNLNVLP